MIKKLYFSLLWKFKVIKTKLKYPTAGHYTTLCLAAQATMEDIDQWVEEAKPHSDIYGFHDDMTIEEMREIICESEVSYWEE